MAQRVAVEMVCDIDGTPGASEVTFGLDGVSYAIDLSGERSEDLRAILRPFVENARRVGGRKIRGAGMTPARPAAPVRPAYERKAENGQIRAWARENGIAVGEKGRISEDIKQQYRDAQREPAPVAPKATPARRRAPRRTAAK